MTKTDEIRRGILWVTFSISSLLLWDSWMRYAGQPVKLNRDWQDQIQQGTPAPVAPAQNLSKTDARDTTPVASRPAAVVRSTVIPVREERHSVTVRPSSDVAGNRPVTATEPEPETVSSTSAVQTATLVLTSAVIAPADHPVSSPGNKPAVELQGAVSVEKADGTKQANRHSAQPVLSSDPTVW